METISIRRKGYPIRHLFRDFIDRYRLLAPGIGPAHREGDCRAAAEKICRTALVNEDFQIGRTKVFLKVRRSVFLASLFVVTRSFRTRTTFIWSNCANR